MHTPGFSFHRLLPIALAAGLAAGAVQAQDGWLEKGQDMFRDLTGGDSPAAELTTGEIASGLKEALRVGTERVVAQLGQVGGFATDPAIHIPLPDTLDRVKSALEKVGMDAALQNLELKLNRAAEAATPKAKELFWQSIQQMSLDDARKIYSGPDDAATQYFRSTMSVPLAEAMRPIVDESLAQVGAIQAYEDVMADYRELPFMPDAQANLNQYVVGEGLNGIFYYLAREEAAIRENPAARTTDLLKRVFGSGG